MRFQIGPKAINVVRVTKGDNESPRERLGSIEIMTLEPSAALLKACTVEERAEVAEWTASQRLLASVKKEAAARLLPEQIELTVSWLESSPEKDTRAVKSAIAAVLPKLRKMLRSGEN
jgi:hypothetical protein